MDEWHFPRAQLANHYLSVLELGISSNLAIIAPRRRGKTLFVLRDLAPLAQKKKYIPVYASLWQNINAPHEGLLTALEEAVQSVDRRAVFNRLLRAKIKKTTVSNELLGRMEVEFADNPSKPANRELACIEKLLAELQAKAGRKTVLLLIDEIQHLATSKAFDPLTYALRTLLDKRQGLIKSVFIGSSRHYMNLLFNEVQSPFYHFVEPVAFPDLDKEFIDFLRVKLANDHRISIAARPLQKVFSAIDCSPYWMMKIVAHMITFRIGVDEAREHVFELMEAAEGFEAIARRMKPIDKIVFLALCGRQNPFAKEFMARIGRETRVKGVPPNIQRSIQRLSAANLISRIHKGEYYIEKPGLKRYLDRDKYSSETTSSQTR